MPGDRTASGPAGVQAFRLALCALVLLLGACVRQGAAPATAGDCTVVRVWSNDWHTYLALPADALGDEHPVRALFPQANYFLVGWGDREYYMDPEAGTFMALRAALLPTRSVVHVVAGREPVEETVYQPREMVDVALSRDGLRAIADGIAATLAQDEAGAPVILAEGLLPGASLFLAAEPAFHLFRMCNHWTAGMLAEGGVPLRPSLAFTAPSLMRTLEGRAIAACPVGEAGPP